MNFLEPQKIDGFFKFLCTYNINVFYSELEGNRRSKALANGDYNDYDNAGLLGIRSDFTPSENFTFGVSRVSMLGGEGPIRSGQPPSFKRASRLPSKRLGQEP